jgi:hypothetical protein
MVAEWERLERLPSEKLCAELSNQLTTVKTRI